jgi:hypothetical protein
VHAALEEAQILINNDHDEFEPAVDKFEQSLMAQGLPEADYRHRLTDGRRLLKNLLGARGEPLTKGALPEYKVTDLFLDDIRLSGTFDVLDSSGEQTIITDYKTGRPLRTLHAKGADGIKAWQHTLQLNFYALLAELDPAVKVKAPLVCRMLYVEAGKASERVLGHQPSKDDLTRLGSLIRAVWQHIMDLDFPDTSSYPPTIEGIKQFEDDLINGAI